MAHLNKTELKAKADLVFPNNTSGLITPAILVDFLKDVIDSALSLEFMFSSSGDWTIGNYLPLDNANVQHEHLVPKSITIFEMDFLNDAILSTGVEVEIMKSPSGGSPTVMETVPLTIGSGDVITLTGFTLAEDDTVGVRLKTAPITPSNMVIKLRYTIN